MTGAAQPIIQPRIWHLVRLLLILGFALVLIRIFPLITNLIVVLIISIVLTYIFKPGVTALEEIGVPRVYSILCQCQCQCLPPRLSQDSG